MIADSDEINIKAIGIVRPVFIIPMRILKGILRLLVLNVVSISNINSLTNLLVN